MTSKEELLQVYSILLQIETKGESTMLMAAALAKIKDKLQQTDEQ